MPDTTEAANLTTDPIVRYRLAILALILVTAAALASPWFARDAYHSDEYRTMGRSLAILRGDIFIEEVPSQKPPLLYMTLAGLYALAGASEAVGIAVGTFSSLGILTVVFLLGETLWGSTRLGLLAALLAALAPIHILFTPTLFLDPPMILLGLMAWLAAARGSPLQSGLLLGLAFATKQQGVLFAGLALPTLLLVRPGDRVRTLAVAAMGMLATGGLAILWSAGNTDAPFHFLIGQVENEQRIIGQSLLVLPWVEGWDTLALRFWGWWQILEVTSIAPLAATAALAVLAVFVARPPDRTDPLADRRRGLDLLVLAWILALVALHVVVRFRLIDRYLLPIVPILALANARVLAAGLADGRSRIGRGLAFLGLFAILAGSLMRLPNLEQVGALDTGRRVGVLWLQRTDLKSTMRAFRDNSRPDDLVACEYFLCDAVRFWLWPRRDVPRAYDAIPRLKQSSEGRRFLVWDASRPIERLTERLGEGYVLVPRGSRSGVITILEVLDKPGFKPTGRGPGPADLR